MFRRIAALALLAALALTPASRNALAQDGINEGGQGRALMILARDGAFAGKLWSLAGRPLALDAGVPAAASLMTDLTDAHGWSAADRAGWRALDLADAARLLCRGEVAALATIATPHDLHLGALADGCPLRLVPLDDAVSRAFADREGGLRLAMLPSGSHPALALGGTTLIEGIQVAER